MPIDKAKKKKEEDKETKVKLVKIKKIYLAHSDIWNNQIFDTVKYSDTCKIQIFEHLTHSNVHIFDTFKYFNI